MLQRIQTIYLIIYLVLSGVVLSGVSILNFDASGDYIQESIQLNISSQQISGDGKLTLPAESVSQFSEDMKELPFDFDAETQTLTFEASSPLLIVQILLMLFAVMTIFGYKNLKRQLNLARATFFLTLLYVLGVMAMVYFALDYANPYLDKIPLDNLIISRQSNLGFYLICAMLPFAYLAQMGIKRDLNLIKSLDRLR
jgi:hypothetical protein